MVRDILVIFHDSFFVFANSGDPTVDETVESTRATLVDVIAEGYARRLAFLVFCTNLSFELIEPLFGRLQSDVDLIHLVLEFVEEVSRCLIVATLDALKHESTLVNGIEQRSSILETIFHFLFDLFREGFSKS